MPRSIEDALAHADELAAEFEAFDPADAVALTDEEWAIVEATAAQAAAERTLREAVVAARRADVSWRAIARILGISHQAAHRRYAEWAGEQAPAPARPASSTTARLRKAPKRASANAKVASKAAKRAKVTRSATAARTKKFKGTQAASAAARAGAEDAARSREAHQPGRA
jgi:hypothetical protein